MRRFIFLGCALRASLIVILSLSGASAQIGATAQLSGRLIDPSGASIPNQTIVLRRTETGQELSATTSAAGYYEFPAVAPGFYEIVVKASGFASIRLPVELTVGSQAVLNLEAKIGETAQQTTVTARTDAIEPTRTDMSEVVEERRIENLPINGRQFLDFVLLTPNVHPGRSNIANPATPGEPKQIDLSFAGLHESTTLVLVDGADDMNKVFGRARSTPSQEAVREFEVLNDSYAAALGPSTAGVVSIVTKSGTNELHGSLYEYFRNNALDARNILAAPGFDELRQNQFGVTLGGPLIQDRLFYFANYEGQRRVESPFYSSVLLNNVAAINRAKIGLGLPPEVLAGILRQTDYDTFFARADFLPNSRNNVGVTYRFREDRDTNLPAATNQLSAPSNFRNAGIDDHAGTVNWLSTFSATALSQTTLQFAGRAFNFPAVTSQPHLQIANTLDIGRHFNAVDGYDEFRFEATEGIAWSIRSHTIRFGGNVSPTRDHFTYDPFDPAYIVFPNLNAFLGAPPFPGPFAVTFGFAIAPNGTRPPAPPGFTAPANIPAYNSFIHQSNSQTNFGLFAQDQWRLTQNLTVNYGVRWDVDRMPVRAFDTYWKAVQPRVGLAYSFLNDSLVLRAGAGYYQGQAYSLVYLIAQVAGQDASFGFPQAGYAVFNDTLHSPFYSNPAQATAAALQFLHTGVYPALNPTNFTPAQQFVSTVKRYNHGGPYSYQWNAQVDAQLARDVVLSVSYLGVRGLGLPSAYGGNVAPTTFRLADGKADYAIAPGSTVTHTIDPLISPLSLFFDASAQSIYHAATIAIAKRFAGHFSMTANYTWSKTIDDSSDPSLNGYPEDPYRRYLERANSKQDFRQQFVATAIANGPDHGWVRNFVLAGTATAESAPFYTIFAGMDVNHDGNANTDRAGTLARDTYRGDRLVNFNLRLARSITLREWLRAEAIAEAFNLFNTLNVTDINTVYGAANFIGAVPRSFGDGALAPLASFGVIRAIEAPRQIQFALRLQF